MSPDRYLAGLSDAWESSSVILEDALGQGDDLAALLVAFKGIAAYYADRVNGGASQAPPGHG